MAETQELIVDLRLRDNISLGLANVKDQIGNFGDTVSLQAIKANNAIGNLGDNIRTRFAAMGADIKKGIGLGLGIGVAQLAAQATTAVVGFFTDSIKASLELEATNQRLKASLEANIPAFDGNTKALQEAANAAEALGFDNSDVLDSFGRIVAVTHDVTKAIQVQNVAMDLARFKGVDLATATQALITVEAGRYRGLAQLGIVLKEGATQAEAFAAVQKVAGGQAEAFGKTTSGALAAAAVAVQNLQEDIGIALAPTIKDLAVFLRTDLLPALRQVGEFLAHTSSQFDESAGATERNLKAWKETTLVSTDLSAALVFQSLQIDHTHDSTVELTDAFDANADSADSVLGPVGLMPSRFRAVSEDAITLTGHLWDLTDAERAAADQAQRLAGGGIGSTVNLGGENIPRGGKSLGDVFIEDLHDRQDRQDKANRDAEERDRQAEQRRGQRLSQAKQDASAYADVLKHKVADAYDVVKRTSDTLFDAQHARVLRAINDAEKLAETQHDAATQQISDTLKLRLQQDAAPVDAAEAAQRQLELSRQRRDLGEGLRSAQASGDPVAIRNAQEALQSFNAAQRIDALKLTQSKLDLAAQTEAAAAQKVADDALAAAKTAQAKAITDETARNKKQQDDFDRALDKLKVKDAGNPAKFKKDALALQEKFGIFTDPNGFHHIADAVTDAIKTIKIAPPVFSPTIVYNPPVFSISGRILASYIATSQSPSATPGVRTGTLSPRPGG